MQETYFCCVTMNSSLHALMKQRIFCGTGAIMFVHANKIWCYYNVAIRKEDKIAFLKRVNVTCKDLVYLQNMCAWW